MAVGRSSDYSVKQKSLNKELEEGRILPAYLFYGEEAYLRDQNKKKVLKNAMNGGIDMNFCRYSGRDIDVRALIDFARTIPFMADRRVILVENSGLFKSGSKDLTDNDYRDMADYLKEPEETACIIFEESEVDKRRNTFKALSAGGGFELDCIKQDARTLKIWISGKLRSAGKSASDDTINLFLEYTGTDMFNISNETEKLISYCADRTLINETDVRAVCSGWTEGRIFDMTDAISEHDRNRALEIYADLLTLGESEQLILSQIVRQMDRTLQAGELSDRGLRADELAAALGLGPKQAFLAPKYVRWARAFRAKRLKELLELAASLDEAFKTGRLDPRLEIEMLIVECCR